MRTSGSTGTAVTAFASVRYKEQHLSGYTPAELSHDQQQQTEGPTGVPYSTLGLSSAQRCISLTADSLETGSKSMLKVELHRSVSRMLHDAQRGITEQTDALLLLAQPPSSAYNPDLSLASAVVQHAGLCKQFRSQLIKSDRSVLGILDLYYIVRQLARSYPHPQHKSIIPCGLVLASLWTADSTHIHAGNLVVEVDSSRKGPHTIPVALQERPFIRKFLAKPTHGLSNRRQQH